MKKILIFSFLILLPLFLVAETYNVIGVYVQELSQRKIDVMGLEENFGIIIDDVVKDGPADMAGLKKEDIILKIDNAKVRTVGQIGKMLQMYKPGENVRIEYLRDGIGKTVQVTIKEKVKKIKPYMGILLRSLKKKDFLAEEMTEMYGIKIKKVITETPADDAGLLGGDILMQINGEKIFTQSQLDEVLRDYTPGDKIKLQIFRDGKTKKINLTLGQKNKEDKM